MNIHSFPTLSVFKSSGYFLATDAKIFKFPLCWKLMLRIKDYLDNLLLIRLVALLFSSTNLLILANLYSDKNHSAGSSY